MENTSEILQLDGNVSVDESILDLSAQDVNIISVIINNIRLYIVIVVLICQI